MNLRIFVKKVTHRLSNSIIKKSDFLEMDKKKKIKECYICGERFENFYKYRINSDNEGISNYFKIVGSDTENYGCYYCNCIDRDRHLFMFFDKLAFWDKFKNAKILLFSPEPSLAHKIEQCLPLECIKCDLYPKEGWRQIDVTKISFDDSYFDIIICNHVLEHVPDHLQALKEISRVLKKDGVAILQTPYSELLYNHFEDKNIDTDELRLLFYGQEDHVRIVSKRQFMDELSRYFTVNFVKNQTLFTNEECFKYGVNMKEDLVMVINNKDKK